MLHQNGQLLIQLLAANGRFVAAKVITGLAAGGDRGLVDHAQSHFAVAGVVLGSDIEVFARILGVFDILAVRHLFAVIMGNVRLLKTQLDGNAGIGQVQLRQKAFVFFA